MGWYPTTPEEEVMEVPVYSAPTVAEPGSWKSALRLPPRWA